MLTVVAKLWRYIFGPNVERIHKSNDGRNRAYNYYQNDIEQLGQRFLTAADFLKNALYYSSPVVIYIVYKKGCCLWATLLNSFRICGWTAMVVGGALVVRGFGRTRNKEYVEFLKTLGTCIDDPSNKESRALLRRYDFDFWYWPVDYIAAAKKERGCYKQRCDSVYLKRLSAYSNTHDLLLYGLPKETFAFVAGNTVGLWLLFPGSMGLLNLTCASSMRSHRNRLIEERGGIRAKLETVDGNFIDTIFFDRRGVRGKACCVPGMDEPLAAKTPNGTTLVVCCEGNSGFYECGIIGTPLECGYSVLGWNHPGFMCSTGSPYPQSDVYALEVVMEYAVGLLGFTPPNIILFGWSIGGFCAISVASLYPDLRGIVLDATFHDVLVFARRLAPPYFDNLITLTGRTYLNMNNACNLRAYKGPVTFIRREKDEVMNLGGAEKPQTNAGNRLFEDFLRTRFPNLFEKRPCGVVERDCPQALLLRSWLAVCNEDCRDNLMNKWDVHSGESQDIMRQAICDGRVTFPMQVGNNLTAVQKSRCVLFLAHKYMHHFNSSHCTPLPPCLFIPPFKLESLMAPQPQVCSDEDLDSNDKPVSDVRSNFLPLF